MYRNHPLAAHIRQLRHKPYFRPSLYGCIVLLSVYVLYHTTHPQSSSSIDFPTSNVYQPPVEVSEEVWVERANHVKLAFLHAYHGYERYALPHDELKPLSGRYQDDFGGWGVTLFDSLDTMLLLDLKKEYERAIPYVEKAVFAMPEDDHARYFETVIRYLGGLLSAYAISNETVLLERADRLADKLDNVFNTPSGFPMFGVNPSSGAVSGIEIGVLAEMASLQMEYTMLAKATGKKRWWDRANTVIQALASANLKYTGGMLPIKWNLTTAQPHDVHLSVGAQADSAHEYLLKQFLLTARTDKTSLEMYLRATTHVIANLLYLSPTRHMLYVTDSDTSPFDARGKPSHVFEHLSCFFPGLLALGAHTLPLDDLKSLGINFEALGSESSFGHAGKAYRQLSQYNLKELHLWAAEGLAQTCWLTYADEPTGLGPDEIEMKTSKFSDGFLWMDAMDRWKASGARGIPPGVEDKVPDVYTEEDRIRGNGLRRDYAIKRKGYLLRPETIESLYLLWRITGDSKWRHRGWKIFEAIERHTKTPYGYASLRTVEIVPSLKDDEMPSYFLAETLKYLYLMFVSEDLVPLDKWVFNTEAHPFPVFAWTEEEKERFNI
ncbi:glycoside hydrolase family 47 protein [Dendrothele bispora CBS 962.96]|uniref:alpha-1,2-Mannosidase n=1 Tax=Dendrothele bispora (strain CBS 962.96) TaxID=1314807 RepID=A0A4S8LQN9_DENBC|nr:glycoside hydrolase family 47 protein [Dendrothele bispora CBS 962.96]